MGWLSFIPTILGAIGVLGGAASRVAQGREEAAAARQREEALRREQEAEELRMQQEQERLAQEREQELGSMRARLAAAGVSMGGGSPRYVLDLTRSRFDEEEEDQKKLGELTRQGFAADIAGARRAASAAGRSGLLGGATSLLRPFVNRL